MAIDFDLDLGHVAVGGLNRAQQVLDVQDADDVLRLVLPDGQPRVRAGERLRDDPVGRIVAVEGAHVRPVDHDIGDFELAETEQVVDELGVALLHFAMLGRNVYETFDLVIGEDVLVSRFLHAKHAQDRP